MTLGFIGSGIAEEDGKGLGGSSEVMFDGDAVVVRGVAEIAVVFEGSPDGSGTKEEVVEEPMLEVQAVPEVLSPSMLGVVGVGELPSEISPFHCPL